MEWMLIEQEEKLEERACAFVDECEEFIVVDGFGGELVEQLQEIIGQLDQKLPEHLQTVDMIVRDHGTQLFDGILRISGGDESITREKFAYRGTDQKSIEHFQRVISEQIVEKELLLLTIQRCGR